VSLTEGLIYGIALWALAVVVLVSVFRPRAAPRPAPDRDPPLAPCKTKARSAAELDRLMETLPQAKVRRVKDGDTIVVITEAAPRTIIRLDSIDCPEDGQHWGKKATHGLMNLVWGRTVHLEVHGIDDFGRTLATLHVRNANGDGWQNVNERMVTLGHAWVMRQYYDHLPPDRQDRLNKLEAWAKSKNVGLWGTPDPIPPWQWRREVWQPPARAR
jgi:micrococcal nuclease